MKIFKTKFHIPTETYGFMEVELEGTAEETAKAYLDIKETFIKVKTKRDKDKPPF